MGPLVKYHHGSNEDFNVATDVSNKSSLLFQGLSAPKKRVTISPTSELYQFEDEEFEDRSNLWYSRSDYRKFNEANIADLRAHHMARGRRLDPDVHCVRGLELGEREKMKKSTYAWSVLAEQERIRRHIGRIYVDSRYLALACTQSVTNFQSAVDAYRRGGDDYAEAYGNGDDSDDEAILRLVSSFAEANPKRTGKRKDRSGRIHQQISSLEQARTRSLSPSRCPRINPKSGMKRSPTLESLEISDSDETSVDPIDETSDKTSEKQEKPNEDFNPIAMLESWGSAVMSIANNQ